MIFPVTSILDDFNRANEGPPPSASWITGPKTESNSNGLVIDTNRVKATSLTYGGTASWGVTFGPDVEVYVSDSDAGGVFILYWRITDPTDTTLMYGYRFSGYNFGGNRTFTVDSLNGLPIDTATLWTSTLSGTIANGDQVGISHIGDQISVYENLGGGGWNLVNTITDNTYSSAGYIGMGLGSTTGRLDNFGGGEISTPVSIGLDARFNSATINHVQGRILGTTTGSVGLWAGASTAALVIDSDFSAAGTTTIGIEVADNALIYQSRAAGTGYDLKVDAASEAKVDDVTLINTTQSIAGTLTPLRSDRAVFDTATNAARHASDISDSSFTYHHNPALLSTYTVTNPVTDRTFDATSTTLNELAAIVGTLLSDLGLA